MGVQRCLIKRTGTLPADPRCLVAQDTRPPERLPVLSRLAADCPHSLLGPAPSCFPAHARSGSLLTPNSGWKALFAPAISLPRVAVSAQSGLNARGGFLAAHRRQPTGGSPRAAAHCDASSNLLASSVSLPFYLPTLGDRLLAICWLPAKYPLSLLLPNPSPSSGWLPAGPPAQAENLLAPQ